MVAGYSNLHDVYNSTNLLSIIQNIQNLRLKWKYSSVADISILEWDNSLKHWYYRHSTCSAKKWP